MKDGEGVSPPSSRDVARRLSEVECPSGPVEPPPPLPSPAPPRAVHSATCGDDDPNTPAVGPRPPRHVATAPREEVPPLWLGALLGTGARLVTAPLTPCDEAAVRGAVESRLAADGAPPG